MEKTTEKPSRLIPPKELFLSEESVVASSELGPNELTTPTYWVDTPLEGGVLSYEVGSKYPRKGWPFSQAVYAIDTIKRLIINSAKLLSSSPFRYLFAPFLLLPDSTKKKAIRKVVLEFSDYTTIVFDRWGRMLEYEDSAGKKFGLAGVMWKPHYYCDMVREFRRVAFEISDPDYHQLINTISMILEFDDAYRYRAQDLFGEIDREAVLKNPGKEFARVIKIGMDRGEGTSAKFGYILKLVPAIFMIKCFREVVIEFFKRIDLKKMSLDEIDTYRCMFWGGYQFGGIPDEDRASMRIMIDAEWKTQQEKSKKEVLNK